MTQLPLTPQQVAQVLDVIEQLARDAHGLQASVHPLLRLCEAAQHHAEHYRKLERGADQTGERLDELCGEGATAALVGAAKLMDTPPAPPPSDTPQMRNPGDEKCVISLRVKPRTLSLIDAAAKVLGISRTQFLLDAARRASPAPAAGGEGDGQRAGAAQADGEVHSSVTTPASEPSPTSPSPDASSQRIDLGSENTASTPMGSSDGGVPSTDADQPYDANADASRIAEGARAYLKSGAPCPISLFPDADQQDWVLVDIDDRPGPFIFRDGKRHIRLPIGKEIAPGVRVVREAEGVVAGDDDEPLYLVENDVLRKRAVYGSFVVPAKKACAELNRMADTLDAKDAEIADLKKKVTYWQEVSNQLNRNGAEEEKRADKAEADLKAAREEIERIKAGVRSSYNEAQSPDRVPVPRELLRAAYWCMRIAGSMEAADKIDILLTPSTESGSRG